MEDFLSVDLRREFEALTASKDPAGKSDNIGKMLFWQKAIAKMSCRSEADFAKIHQLWLKLYEGQVPIAWFPTSFVVEKSNIGKLMRELKIDNYKDLYSWSVQHRADFWDRTIQKLQIRFQKPYKTVLNLDKGVEDPLWLEGAKMNIAESCFQGEKKSPAIIQGSEHEAIRTISVEDFHTLVNKIASGLIREGFQAGDKIVMYVPLTIESIAAYLAMVKAGMVVVSVADSFSAPELKKRIEITKAKGIFTCDGYRYGGKEIKIFSKVQEAEAPKAIICNYLNAVTLRGDKQDKFFDDILYSEKFDFHYADPDAATNILFSSGTTKEPKAIPWTHLTPVKCASDGYYHQNIQSGDVVCWTTGMGWMMAPWLIYSTLINKATIAIYTGATTGDKFGEFVSQAKINMLGTIPSVVKAWRANDFINKFKWNIKVFSSTGEPSNAEDYFYLMALADFKAPVIEYCGGTEIGGGYITGTVVQPASPATFTTPALGINFYLLNGEHKASKEGEVFIVPPSIGLTQKLLNRDHHEEYYKDVPKGPNREILRKHGDAFETEEAPGATFYKSIGRTDDAMNLGGIKVSAVEIEEVLNRHEQIFETAAISVPSEGGGPEKLIVYAVVKNAFDKDMLKKELQQQITTKLNPLFKIAEIIEIKTLPRTASNKLMRRELRKEYMNK
ncbi:MAG: AMP-binding protein [Cytophagaceae bacterium]|nr:AMP-binding protein [Cytophagaceae bacterium]